MSDPLTSLELRLRFLNTLVHGQPNQVATGQKSNHLVKRLIRSNALLSNTVQGNAGLESFIHDYEKNLPFLLPSLAASPHAQGNRQSALASVTHESISDDLLLDYFSTNRPLDPRLQFQILLESEHDLALAAKDLEECSQLERKGVTGAGRLGETEELVPRLLACVEADSRREGQVDALRNRLGSLIGRYGGYVDDVSRIFLSLDEVLTELEKSVGKLERQSSET